MSTDTAAANRPDYAGQPVKIIGNRTEKSHADHYYPPAMPPTTIAPKGCMTSEPAHTATNPANGPL